MATKVLYTTEASATGGRDGQAATKTNQVVVGRGTLSAQ
jgi:hypothetical protein